MLFSFIIFTKRYSTVSNSFLSFATYSFLAYSNYLSISLLINASLSWTSFFARVSLMSY
jgi:hypothetical protein